MYKNNYYFPIRTNLFSKNVYFSFFDNFDLDKFYFTFLRDFDILNFLFFKEFYNISFFRTFFVNYSFSFINFITFYKFCDNDFYDIQISKDMSFIFGSFFVFDNTKTSYRYYYVFSLIDFSIALYFENNSSVLPVAFFKYSFYDYKRFVTIFNNVIKNSNKSFIFIDENTIKIIFSKFFSYLISVTPLPFPIHFKRYNSFSKFFYISDIIYSNSTNSFSFYQPIEYFTFSFIFKNFCSNELYDFDKIKVFTFYKYF
jgi:hypothetical protein